MQNRQQPNLKKSCETKGGNEMKIYQVPIFNPSQKSSVR